MKSWVAFLFDSKDQGRASFPGSNRSFCKKGAKTIDKEGKEVVNANVSPQIGDWWEFDSGNPDDPLFFMLMCDMKQKDTLWEKVDNGTVPIEEVIECLPARLVKWASENGNGIVFMHWHKDGWGLCHGKTEALQKSLVPLFPSLKIRCFSSQLTSPKFGKVIFNVDTPVIPVKDFIRWFDMFEQYWNARTSEQLIATDASYDETTFPCHWELGSRR